MKNERNLKLFHTIQTVDKLPGADKKINFEKCGKKYFFIHKIFNPRVKIRSIRTKIIQ